MTRPDAHTSGSGRTAAVRSIAVAIVVDRDDRDRILIARRRAGGPFGGYWELPGGHCRPGEGFEACAIREVFEETGLEVRSDGAAALVIHPYPEFIVEIHAFFCAVLGGEARPLASDEIAWVRWDELERYQFPPANAELFAQARRNR